MKLFESSFVLQLAWMFTELQLNQVCAKKLGFNRGQNSLEQMSFALKEAFAANKLLLSINGDPPPPTAM